MNKLDKDYLALCQDILDNGTKKMDRTGTGTMSVFGRQIRHSMNDGFPLLTTKKVHFKSVVSELLWFLQGRTDLRWLLEQGNTIWVGDCYSNYERKVTQMIEQGVTKEWTINDWDMVTIPKNLEPSMGVRLLTKEEFINKIKTDNEFAKKWGELGPIYGKQWRNWKRYRKVEDIEHKETLHIIDYIDQIADAIHNLKTNPDDRGIIVSAWNVGELDQMVLRPCHNFFQFYTRELSFNERYNLIKEKTNENPLKYSDENGDYPEHIQKPVLKWMEKENIPTRAISLMFNMRSVDVPLGLPFNIASYGLLLEIIAKMVNMVPDELIGNLGDCHIYTNQIEGIKEQIGRELSLEERCDEYIKRHPKETNDGVLNYKWIGDNLCTHEDYDKWNIPTRTREPYPLPKLNINTEFWPTESGECGVGSINAQAVLDGFSKEDFCKCLMEEDIQLANYKSHPAIKIPLSN